MNRPLVWVALAVATGIGAASFGAASSMSGVLILLALGLVFSFLPRHSYYLQPLGVFLLFAAVGAANYSARHAGPPGDPLSRSLASFPDTPWTLEGRVRSVQLWQPADKTQNFVLDVERVRVAGAELPLSGRVSVRWSEADAPVFADERVRVTGRLSLALSEVNPGVPGYEDYLRRRGIHSRLGARGAALERLIPARAWSPTHWASRLRQGEAALFGRAVPKSARSFIMTVWLGDSLRSEDDSYRAYIDSGTAHILSVSGLHLAIVYATAQLVLPVFFPRRERLRTGLVFACAWVFTLAAGAAVACVRSAIMVSLYLAGRLFRRESDIASSLGLSASLFLLASPDLLFDAGFQLSFLSVSSMLLYADPLAESMGRLPHTLRNSLAASLSAQILPLPAAVQAFHVLPLAAPLANLAVVPLLAVVLWLTFLTAAAGLLPWDLASIPGHALLSAVYLIRAVAQGVSSVHGARLALTSPTLPAVIAYAGAAWMLWTALKRSESRRLFVAAGLLLAAVLLWKPFHRPAEVVFLDVGAGDSAFVCTAGGSTVLIDCGDRLDRNGRERVVVPYLQSNRVARLDYVVVSHSDRDHSAGLHDVLETFSVGTVLLPETGVADEEEQTLLDLCAKRKVPVRRLVRGDTVNLAGGRLVTLYPGPGGPVGPGTNNRSLVLRLDWSGPSVLFAGDIEAEAESEVASTDCRAEVLKVPHHGSDTSSTDAFIAAVAPRQCIVSTGQLRGRPLARDWVLARYAARGIGIWRTDHVGGIRLTPAGTAYRLEGTRPARGYPVPSNEQRRRASASLTGSTR